MKDLIEELQMLDIPRREAEVYLALLQKREFTAPEIAKITSISRTKAYELLQNLEKKGLCKENYRNGVKVFSSIEPKIVIENIVSGFNMKKELANHLCEKLSTLHVTGENLTDSLDYIEVLTDMGQISDRFLNILNNSQKEILVFTKPPYSVPSMKNNIHPVAELTRRNVKVKGIYEYSTLKTLAEINFLIEVMEAYESIGEETRIVNELPMKLAICDETITMLALKDRISLKPSISTIIINHPSFAAAQKYVFESYWATSLTLHEFKKDLHKYIDL